MLKRYLVVNQSVWTEQCATFFDNLDEAKAYAKEQAKQGNYMLVFETLYEFDPEDFKKEDNELPPGDLPNDQLPWAWIN